MRALIYGGRDWDDQDKMNRVLDALHAEHRFSMIMTGGQQSWCGARKFGADWQAYIWARPAMTIDVFPADWLVFGKAAGPIRNKRMLIEGRPDIGVEFPGGKGTRGMRRQLQDAGIPVIFAKDHPAFATPPTQDAAA